MAHDSSVWPSSRLLANGEGSAITPVANQYDVASKRIVNTDPAVFGRIFGIDMPSTIRKGPTELNPGEVHADRRNADLVLTALTFGALTRLAPTRSPPHSSRTMPSARPNVRRSTGLMISPPWPLTHNRSAVVFAGSRAPDSQRTTRP
jgi:hypothetical protein